MDAMMPQTPQPGTAQEPHDARVQAIFPPNLMHNTNQFASIRTLSSIASGLTAGILGLENLWGFALYLASIVMGAMLVSGLQCQGKPSKYFQNGWWDLLMIDQDGFLAFLLSWIGLFAVVHVYD